MKVENVDERQVRAVEVEAEYVLYLFEARGQRRSTDVFIFHDALFSEVMSWVAARLKDSDALWALGVLAAERTELVWLIGGDPHQDLESSTAQERARLLEMRRTGPAVFLRSD